MVRPPYFDMLKQIHNYAIQKRFVNAKDLISQARLISKIPTMPIPSLCLLADSLDRIGVENKELWQLILENFRITGNYLALKNVTMMLHYGCKHLPGSISWEQLEKMLITRLKDDPDDPQNIDILYFFNKHDKGSPELWKTFQKPVINILLKSIQDGNGIVTTPTERLLVKAGHSYSSQRQGDATFWTDLQNLLIPIMPSLKVNVFSRLCYYISKMAHVTPEFKTAFTTNFVSGLNDPVLKELDVLTFLYVLPNLKLDRADLFYEIVYKRSAEMFMKFSSPNLVRMYVELRMFSSLGSKELEFIETIIVGRMVKATSADELREILKYTGGGQKTAGSEGSSLNIESLIYLLSIKGLTKEVKENLIEILNVEDSIVERALGRLPSMYPIINELMKKNDLPKWSKALEDSLAKLSQKEIDLFPINQLQIFAAKVELGELNNASKDYFKTLCSNFSEYLSSLDDDNNYALLASQPNPDFKSASGLYTHLPTLSNFYSTISNEQSLPSYLSTLGRTFQTLQSIHYSNEYFSLLALVYCRHTGNGEVGNMIRKHIVDCVEIIENSRPDIIISILGKWPAKLEELIGIDRLEGRIVVENAARLFYNVVVMGRVGVENRPATNYILEGREEGEDVEPEVTRAKIELIKKYIKDPKSVDPADFNQLFPPYVQKAKSENNDLNLSLLAGKKGSDIPTDTAQTNNPISKPTSKNVQVTTSTPRTTMQTLLTSQPANELEEDEDAEVDIFSEEAVGFVSDLPPLPTPQPVLMTPLQIVKSRSGKGRVILGTIHKDSKQKIDIGEDELYRMVSAMDGQGGVNGNGQGMEGVEGMYSQEEIDDDIGEGGGGIGVRDTEEMIIEDREEMVKEKNGKGKKRKSSGAEKIANEEEVKPKRRTSRSKTEKKDTKIEQEIETSEQKPKRGRKPKTPTN